MSLVRRALPIVLLLVSLLAFADSLKGTESPEVVVLRELYRRAAVPFPSVSFPVSRDWLHKRAGELLDRSPRLDQELRIYLDQLDYNPEVLRIDSDLVLNPELFYDPGDLRTDNINENLRRDNPALTLGLSASVDGGPIIYARGDLIGQYDGNFITNFGNPSGGNILPFEYNVMQEGYLYTEGRFLTANFGRQKVDLGPSELTSVALSRDIPYLDALRLSLDLGPIRMTHWISTLENRKAKNDVVLEDSSGEIPTDDPYWDSYDYEITEIFFNTHYFEYAFERLRLGFGMSMMLSRENNAFQLGDFFPVFSWHNADIVPNNTWMHVDATLPLFGWSELYAQAGVDEVQASDFGIDDRPIPTVPAYLAGARLFGELGGGYLIQTVETGYTHYLWGNFFDYNGLSRGIYRLHTDNEEFPMPINSPYGPGTRWILAVSEYTRDALTLRLRYEAVGRKPGANLVGTAYEEDSALENAAYDWTHRGSLLAEYRFSDSLSASVEPGLYVTDPSPDFYCDLALKASFAGRKELQIEE